MRSRQTSASVMIDPTGANSSITRCKELTFVQLMDATTNVQTSAPSDSVTQALSSRNLLFSAATTGAVGKLDSPTIPAAYDAA